MQKELWLPIFFFLFLLVPFTIWNNKRVRMTAKINSQTFREANINSKLKSARRGYKGVVFEVMNDEREFVFYTYGFFLKRVQKGDMIIKKPFADTLYVIHNSDTISFELLRLSR